MEVIMKSALVAAENALEEITLIAEAHGRARQHERRERLQNKAAALASDISSVTAKALGEFAGLPRRTEVELRRMDLLVALREEIYQLHDRIQRRSSER